MDGVDVKFGALEILNLYIYAENKIVRNEPGRYEEPRETSLCVRSDSTRKTNGKSLRAGALRYGAFAAYAEKYSIAHVWQKIC